MSQHFSSSPSPTSTAPSLLAHAPTLLRLEEAGVLVVLRVRQRRKLKVNGPDYVDEIGEIHVALPPRQKKLLQRTLCARVVARACAVTVNKNDVCTPGAAHRVLSESNRVCSRCKAR